VLDVSDFPDGANVLLEQPITSAFLPRIAYTSVYTRVFEKVSVGQLQIALIVSTAMSARSEAAASMSIAKLSSSIERPTSRSALVAGIKKALTAQLATSTEKLESAKLLRGRTLRIGDTTVNLVFEVNTTNASFEVGEIFVRTGTNINVVEYTTGPPGVPAAQDVAFARTMAAHIKAASLPPPSNTVAPTISGTLQAGEILTVTPGTWTGTAPTLTYVWSRCNADGQSCVAIPNATLATYTISVADQGQELTAAVTATAPSGAATAQAEPTQPIPTA
jgi:hypothetical protein